MILKILNIFSQNVCRNRLLTDTLLENNKEFDILFIHKLPWSIIHNILSLIFEEGKEIVSALNHSSWTIFARILNTENKHPRVLTYINIRISRLHFSLRKKTSLTTETLILSPFSTVVICTFLLMSIQITSNLH